MGWQGLPASSPCEMYKQTLHFCQQSRQEAAPPGAFQAGFALHLHLPAQAEGCHGQFFSPRWKEGEWNKAQYWGDNVWNQLHKHFCKLLKPKPFKVRGFNNRRFLWLCDDWKGLPEQCHSNWKRKKLTSLVDMRSGRTLYLPPKWVNCCSLFAPHSAPEQKQLYFFFFLSRKSPRSF